MPSELSSEIFTCSMFVFMFVQLMECLSIPGDKVNDVNNISRSSFCSRMVYVSRQCNIDNCRTTYFTDVYVCCRPIRTK